MYSCRSTGSFCTVLTVLLFFFTVCSFSYAANEKPEIKSHIPNAAAMSERLVLQADFVFASLVGREGGLSAQDIESGTTLLPKISAAPWNMSASLDRQYRTVATNSSEPATPPVARQKEMQLSALVAGGEATPATAAPVLVAPVWEMAPADKTLNFTLARWTAMAGWQLLWELPVDYVVEARTTLNGSFEQAVEMVVRGMENAEIPVKAIFYKGNKVLRITSSGDK